MLLIAIPCGDMLHTGFFLSTLNLVKQLMVERVPFRTVTVRTSEISMSRTLLVEQAIAVGADEILWLDSDMEFPANTYRLLKDAQLAIGCHIIGGTYPRRDHTGVLAHTEFGNPTGSDIERVWGLPGGCLLVKTEVYQKLGQPYYGHSTTMRDGAVVLRGEDYTFCLRARKAGFETYIHRPLSTKLVHLAEIGLSIVEWPAPARDEPLAHTPAIPVTNYDARNRDAAAEQSARNTRPSGSESGVVHPTGRAPAGVGQGASGVDVVDDTRRSEVPSANPAPPGS